jgi:transcriptional antiterminator RfaH
MSDKNNWYVIYTRSRQERILADQLEQAGFTVFLPMVKKERTWSDRKKIIDAPLFNSYVFIKGVSDKNKFKEYLSFVAFLQYNNKPGIVRQSEIDTIKTILKHGYDVSEADAYENFEIGSQVMVIGGPLKGMVGDLISEPGNESLLIHFENLGNSLQVKIPPKLLKKI